MIACHGADVGPLHRIFRRGSHLATLTVLAGVLLVAVFAAVLGRFRTALRDEVRRTIINRDAAVLAPVAQRQLTQRRDHPGGPADLFGAVLESSQQEGMLAVVVFDADGRTLGALPETLLFAELPFHDYVQLLRSEPISRFHAEFPLDRYFSGASGKAAPVLEVLLPLHGGEAKTILGFAQYYIDARPLARELASVDARIARLTIATLGIGAALIAAVVGVAYVGLRRAARLVAERNERLVRANFELSLAAKASALGQITSHLLHGLQGPVAGLRAVVAGHGGAAPAPDDWATAADYADRMQAMIQEAVALLGDNAARTTYELSGHELVAIVRQRSLATAKRKGVMMRVQGGFDRGLDSHRGGVLCLIASNLVENAVAATEPGQPVAVTLDAEASGHLTMTVTDTGGGIPEELREHLFEPGRSGRDGGSGLGLAISQLLARQIDATLALESTGPKGTKFRLKVPLTEAGR